MAKEITLDSNLLIEYWKNQEKKEYIEELINLSKKGKIDLAITSRIEQDIPSPPLSQMINDLHLLGIQITGSVSRVGLWKLGTDKLGSRDFVKFVESIINKPHAPKIDWRDWDHLHAHFLQNRSVFLTWDTRILSVAKELKNQFSIIVMKPEEFISKEESDN